MRLEQPDPQTAEPPGPRGPSKTVPEDVSKLWASLPRRECQRRRRRFFRNQAACYSRPVLSMHCSTLFTIDARVRILEDALAELRRATAASIPVPSARSVKKRDREDAAPPSSTAPVTIVGRTLAGIPPAAETARNAAPPSPAVSDSTPAAVPCASSPSLAPPVSDGVTRHGSAAATPSRAALSERASPSDQIGALLFGKRATPAPVPSGTVTGPLHPTR